MKNLFYCFALSPFLAGMLLGCGEGPDRVEISEVSEWAPARPMPKLDATSDERFRPDPMFRNASMPSAAPGELDFHWAMPEGWQELAPTDFRRANFRIGPNGEAECYLSVLPGGGGGMEGNANRWRGQMGLDPYAPEEFAALNRSEVLGEEAVYVDFEGAYTGMGAASAEEGFRMAGYLLEYGGSSLYIKMVGPEAIVAAQMDHFQQWVDSLHAATEGHSHGPAPAIDESAALPADHPAIDAGAGNVSQPASSATSAQGFSWTAPEGWQQTGPRTMRLVTYLVGETGQTECYISLLGGSAGGELMNINRWRGQFGESELSEGDVAALPKLTVLGQEVGLVESRGSFTGMRGERKEGQALLGVAWISEAGSVFIKLTGPEAEVGSQKDAFIAFCESLTRD